MATDLTRGYVGQAGCEVPAHVLFPQVARLVERHLRERVDPRPPASVLDVVLLETGDWQAAHVIGQDDASTLAAWLHGIVHTFEGGLGNARYWYPRAARAFPGPAAVQDEISAVRRALEAAAGSVRRRARRAGVRLRAGRP